jgi:hypothetical protein
MRGFQVPYTAAVYHTRQMYPSEWGLEVDTAWQNVGSSQ